MNIIPFDGLKIETYKVAVPIDTTLIAVTVSVPCEFYRNGMFVYLLNAFCCIGRLQSKETFINTALDFINC